MVNGDGRNEKAAAYLYPTCLHLLQPERCMCPFPEDRSVLIEKAKGAFPERADK